MRLPAPEVTGKEGFGTREGRVTVLTVEPGRFAQVSTATVDCSNGSPVTEGRLALSTAYSCEVVMREAKLGFGSLIGLKVLGASIGRAEVVVTDVL